MPESRPNGYHDSARPQAAPGQHSNGGEQPLEELFWRDEILQVMYWMHGEGLGTQVTVTDLQVFLQCDPAQIGHYLQHAVDDGYLTRYENKSGASTVALYALTDMGRREGGRRFADEFAEMQKIGHGECSADCSCHTTGDRSHCPSHHH